MHRSLALVLAASLWAPAASAQTREAVARRWAPTILQETQSGRGRRDFISTYDYDCDWNGDNNRQGLASHMLPARVYYAVYETDTHWFIHYLPYHATDDKLTNGHEHDTESVLLVVRRTDAPLGALEAMETRFHLVWYQYAVDGAGLRNAGDNVDGPVHFDASGRPMVYQQAAGHGLCGGFAPPCITGDYCDLAILCLHNEAPRFNRRGVRYRYDPMTLTPEPRAPGDREVVDASYDLVPIESTLWARRAEIGRGRVYASAERYEGSRCRDADAAITCPRDYGGAFEGDEGDSPGAMWAQEGGNPSLPRGEVFFDPAYAMSRRLQFPSPFSLRYSHNPYAGVGALAPALAGTICDVDASVAPDAPPDAPADATSDAPDAASDAPDATSDAPDDLALDATDATASPDVAAPLDIPTDIATDSPTDIATDSPTDIATDSPADIPVAPTVASEGCGCRTLPAPRASSPSLLALALLARRRSRRPPRQQRSSPRDAR